MISTMKSLSGRFIPVPREILHLNLVIWTFFWRSEAIEKPLYLELTLHIAVTICYIIPNPPTSSPMNGGTALVPCAMENPGADLWSTAHHLLWSRKFPLSFNFLPTRKKKSSSLLSGLSLCHWYKWFFFVLLLHLDCLVAFCFYFYDGDTNFSRVGSNDSGKAILKF